MTDTLFDGCTVLRSRRSSLPCISLVVVNGKLLCDYTNQRHGRPSARKIEGTETHAHPSRAIRAYIAALTEYIFSFLMSTQYAVRRRVKILRALTIRVPGNRLEVPLLLLRSTILPVQLTALDFTYQLCTRVRNRHIVLLLNRYKSSWIQRPRFLATPFGALFILFLVWGIVRLFIYLVHTIALRAFRARVSCR